MKKENFFVSFFVCLLVSSILPFDAASAQPLQTGPGDGPASYRLIGTVQGETFTGAVFVDSDGVQKLLRLRDQLPDGSRIIKVRSESIVLKRTDGSTYELFIARDTKAAVSAVSPARTAPSSRLRNFPLPEPPEGRVPEAGLRNAVPEEKREVVVPDERPENAVPEAEPEDTTPAVQPEDNAPEEPPGKVMPDARPESVPDEPSNQPEQ